jgi:hypothetical protein
MGKLSQLKLILIFGLSLSMLLMGCGGNGKKEGGTIFGYVHDPITDSPFNGAKVTATQQGSRGLNFTTNADESGNYTLNLPPGMYTLNFTHQRSFPHLVKDVKVEAGGKRKVDVTLVISFGGT